MVLLVWVPFSPTRAPALSAAGPGPLVSQKALSLAMVVVGTGVHCRTAFEYVSTEYFSLAGKFAGELYVLDALYAN